VFRDNGVGMTEAVQRRAFDPFFTTSAARRHGLGLHIVYNLVTQRLGGRIVLSSVPGGDDVPHQPAALRAHARTCPRRRPDRGG
jgi:signal transduction histidine kinase